MVNKKTSNNSFGEKKNFIEFISSLSPEEINKLIAEKGKPARIIEPFVILDKK